MITQAMRLSSAIRFIKSVIFWSVYFISFQPLHAESLASQNSYQIQGVSKSLKRLIDTHLKAIPFDEEASTQIRVAESKNTIRRLLEAEGYFQPDIQSLIQPGPPSDPIIYTIATGPKLLITDIDIQLHGEGSSNPVLIQTANNLKAYKRKAMTTPNYQALKEKLYQACISQGYLDATWQTHTAMVNLENYTTHITLALDTQRKYTIGPIQFLKSSSSLNIDFLKSYLGIQTDDPYQLKTILQAQTRLKNSDYFKEALIETPITPHVYQVPLQVTLTPSAKYYALFNIGIRSDLGVRAKAEGAIRYLTATGQQLSGIIEAYRIGFNSLLLYKIPGLFSSTQEHRIQLEYKNRYSTFKKNNENFINHYFPIFLPCENATTLLQYSFIQQYRNFKFMPFSSFYDEHFTVHETAETKRFTGIISGICITQKQANWFNDAHHYKLVFQAKGTSTASQPFFQIEAKSVYFGYLSPLLPSSYLILRTRYARLFTQSLQNIPTSLRFHGGGYGYPRGHNKYLLGPHMLGGGAEMRLHLVKLFYLSPFFEMNYDFKRTKSIKGSTGIGLCLWYPHIGTIEITGVYRINPSHQGRFGIIAKISTSMD